MVLRAACPACFAEQSHSVVMDQKDGVLQCPLNPTHRFKKDENGFFVRVS